MSGGDGEGLHWKMRDATGKLFLIHFIVKHLSPVSYG